MVKSNIWGKHAWKFMHYVTMGYPENPTEEHKNNYKNFFISLKYVLPCSICAKHYEENLEKLPLTDQVLSNRNNLIKWGIDLHNMVNKMCRHCISEWCNTQAKINKYDGYCLFCFINLFPDKPVARNYKTKERTVVEFVLNHFPQFTWISDKKVQDGCSKRRPDLLLDLGFQVIVIEVDENQHISYDCSCENKRLMEISQDVGHRPLVFIRFNPDSYVTMKNEMIKSCWRPNQKGIFIINKDNNNDWNNNIIISIRIITQ
jgi:hypothetical protein